MPGNLHILAKAKNSFASKAQKYDEHPHPFLPALAVGGAVVAEYFLTNRRTDERRRITAAKKEWK
jgi:hypothetical protein